MIGAVVYRPEQFELDPTAEGGWILRDLAAWYAGGGWGTTNALDAWGINHGTLTLMAIPATATSGWGWDSFLRRPVLRFDGSNDYVLGSIPPMIPPLTIAGWSNPTNFSMARAHLTLFSDANNRYQTYLGSGTGPVTARTLAAGSPSAATAGNAVAGSWNHAAGVFASTASRIAYLNGIPGAEVTTTKDPGAVTTFNLGQYPSYHMLGAVADSMFWNRALSAAELTLLADPAWSVLMGGLIVPAGRRYVRGWKPGGAPAAGRRRVLVTSILGG
jgi:hypothetical protein